MDLEDNFSFCKHQYEKQYLTARGTTTRFYPQYNLSAIQRLSEYCFQQCFCMSWPCFLNLLNLIKPDPIFYNHSKSPKQDVSIHLLLPHDTWDLMVMEHLFSDSRIYSVGYGTINLYTIQVIKAIYNMQSKLLSCPTQEEQTELRQVMQEEGFPGCI
ncbi:hypothetical protein VP01_894g7, partial [Puccinia sorghi]